MTPKSCECQAWRENYCWIERDHGIARAYNYLEEAAPFRFCPWCGEELEEEDKIINEDAKPPEGILHGVHIVYNQARKRRE
jgi:hypothetical protein